MRKYSPEFKEVLKKLGMPDYEFNFPCADINTISKANTLKIVRKQYPDEKDFNTLYRLIREEQDNQYYKRREYRKKLKSTIS